jgi:hypothetical protein
MLALSFSVVEIARAFGQKIETGEKTVICPFPA